jgi:hypothetical protein
MSVGVAMSSPTPSFTLRRPLTPKSSQLTAAFQQLFRASCDFRLGRANHKVD